MNINESKALIDTIIDEFVIFVHLVNKDLQEEELLKDVIAQYSVPELKNVTLSELHVVDCIAKNRLINAIGISQKMNITKSGISKITARLLKKNLIEIHRMAGNRKEILYTLTPLGEKAFEIHTEIHEKAYETIRLLMNRYSNEELRCISKFIGQLKELYSQL